MTRAGAAIGGPLSRIDTSDAPRSVKSQEQLPVRQPTRSIASAAWSALSRCLPNSCRINRLVAGVYFRRVHGRAPLPLGAPEGTINDFIFHRMTAGRWSDLERRCVDKISAKEEAARIFAGVRLPRVHATILMDEIRDAAALYHRVSPFGGEDLVAKPAHGSGATLWLAGGLTRAQARILYQAASEDYFWQMRETQYAGLPRRIVIEEALRAPDGSAPDDYKFMCVRGKPVLVQVDHDRFGPNHFRRLYRAPDFELYDPAEARLAPVNWRLADPSVLAEMIALASRLSQPFDYVRIDLLLAEAPYFGEFTFSQGASLGQYTPARGAHGTVPSYNRYLLDVLRADLHDDADVSPCVQREAERSSGTR